MNRMTSIAAAWLTLVGTCVGCTANVNTSPSTDTCVTSCDNTKVTCVAKCTDDTCRASCQTTRDDCAAQCKPSGTGGAG